MNYIDLVGTLPEAIERVRTEGGRLYSGKYRDSCHTVVVGNNCYTYWNKNSKKRQELAQLCSLFNIPSQGQTGGRVARWFLKELIDLPYKGTYWDRNYRTLAKAGSHWHYCFINPNKHFYGVEFDLKSAYFSSLFAGKSLLYQNSIGSMNDNGSLERLKELTPLLPKWFRLQLLGILSSWKIDYWVRPANMKPEQELSFKTSYKIEYCAAFNAAHRAILRNYKIMQKVHQIGGKYIERMHTDSFLLNIECPESIEKSIHNYLEEKGVITDVKAAGFSYFFDLNTGYIGKSIIGCKLDVFDKMRQQRIKMKRDGGYYVVMSKYEQQQLIKEKIQALQLVVKQEETPTHIQLEMFRSSGVEM